MSVSHCINIIRSDLMHFIEYIVGISDGGV